MWCSTTTPGWSDASTGAARYASISSPPAPVIVMLSARIASLIDRTVCGVPDFRPALDGSAHGADDDHLIVVGPNSQIALPVLTLGDVAVDESRRHFLGTIDGVGVWAVDSEEEPDGAAFMPLIAAH